MSTPAGFCAVCLQPIDQHSFDMVKGSDRRWCPEPGKRKDWGVSKVV